MPGFYCTPSYYYNIFTNLDPRKGVSSRHILRTQIYFIFINLLACKEEMGKIVGSKIETKYLVSAAHRLFYLALSILVKRE